MGDDVPILGALVTLLNAMGFCCFWWCFLYIIMVGSSYIIILSGMRDDVLILGAPVTLLNAMGFCCFWWCFLYIFMVGSSYIIIVSGMGDEVPILSAVVTLLNAMSYCCFLWCFLYIIVFRSSYIIIVSGMGDDVPILGAVVTLFEGNGDLVNLVIWHVLSSCRMLRVFLFRFSKWLQSVKKAIAYNVISCIEIIRNTQTAKIADFTM